MPLSMRNLQNRLIFQSLLCKNCEWAWRDRREALKAQAEDLLEERQAALQDAEKAARADAEAAVAAARAEAERTMEEAIQRLRDDSGTIVGRLEAAIRELRDEKKGLGVELDENRRLLEESEDALYDMTQELKNARQARSLAAWQGHTAAMRERAKGEAEVSKVRREERERRSCNA